MEDNYGLLINKDIKLHRAHFREMTSLLGIKVKYKAPIMDYTPQSEMRPLRYKEEQTVGVIFQDHIDQKTAKLLGWNAELMQDAALIHVPYDLEGLQIGGLFEVPSAFEGAPSRLFRVVEMYTIMIYPASVTCRIVPEYGNTAQRSEIEDFSFSNFNLLNEGDYGFEDK